MDLDALIEEFASGGIGQQLYREILGTVRAVVFGHGYPPAYSPTGRWDEDAITALAHDWATDKLLRRGQLEYLFLANETLRGFHKGMELSFRHFLIGQKKRTELDNLFQRANAILEADARFKILAETGRKATRLWGLSTWESRGALQGSDTELIAAGFRVPDVPVIRYRPDARKLSPVISDRDLAEFMLRLFEEIGSGLSLERVVVVFRYRFNLLEAEEVSLDRPAAVDQEGRELALGDTLAGGTLPEDEALAAETAAGVLRELSPRQRRVLLEYARPDATLTSVAELAGCSKSTVENELARVMRAIARSAGGPDEAQAVYERLIEALSSENSVGNSAG